MLEGRVHRRFLENFPLKPFKCFADGLFRKHGNRPGGGDSPGVVLGVGLHAQSEARPVSFTAVQGTKAVGDIHLRVPGDYNAVNALAVLGIASVLEIKWEIACAALERFTGTARRFEILGDVDGIIVIDDYAHHPTQIRSVLQAARQRYPDRRIVAVWEPHTFSRIKALHDDFMTAFETADQVFVLPIYAAREVNDGTLTSDILAQKMRQRDAHPPVDAFATLEEAIFHLTGQAQTGDVIIMMGAGNEYIVGKRLVLELERTS